jgi:hypothetical protein
MGGGFPAVIPAADTNSEAGNHYLAKHAVTPAKAGVQALNVIPAPAGIPNSIAGARRSPQHPGGRKVWPCSVSASSPARGEEAIRGGREKDKPDQQVLRSAFY